MESQNLASGFFLSKEEKKALEKKQAQKKYQESSSPHLQNQQRIEQPQQTPPKVIKRKESKISQGKELPSKITKKEINIQQQEEIKVLKQENEELRNLLSLGQDNLEIRIINQVKELKAYWNIQTEHRQETAKLGRIVQKEELEFIKQKYISTNSTNFTNQKETKKKRLKSKNNQISKDEMLLQQEYAKFERIAKNFRIPGENIGVKNKKNNRDSIVKSIKLIKKKMIQKKFEMIKKNKEAKK